MKNLYYFDISFLHKGISYRYTVESNLDTDQFIDHLRKVEKEQEHVFYAMNQLLKAKAFIAHKALYEAYEKLSFNAFDHSFTAKDMLNQLKITIIPFNSYIDWTKDEDMTGEVYNYQLTYIGNGREKILIRTHKDEVSLIKELAELIGRYKQLFNSYVKLNDLSAADAILFNKPTHKLAMDCIKEEMNKTNIAGIKVDDIVRVDYVIEPFITNLKIIV